MEILKPDICVIGGGSAGLAVAAAAAAFGVPTVLIENHEMGGGRLNTGDIPSKALSAAARVARTMRTGAPFGVTAGDVDIDFVKIRDHVRSVIAAVAPADTAERFTGMGVRVIKGHAAFKDKRTVGVDGKSEIRARRFVIATGSTKALSTIPGLDSGPTLTSESIFDLDALPAHLIVIGGGPTGLELAQTFRRLGSAVTLCDAAQPLANDDPECVAIVLDQLAREGVALRSHVKIISVAHGPGKVTLTIESANGEEKIDGTHLLFAAGRTPDIDGLNLQSAGIRHDKTGIAVNKRLMTSNRRVYAIGDCASGQSRFTHGANYHAELVVRNALFRLPVNANNDVIPRVTYTDPELAQTGSSEAEARKRGFKIRILRWPYHDNDRAHAERMTHGHIKIITTTKGVILGATIAGAQAAELITPWSLAITQKLNIRAMTDMVMPYPTLAEVGKRAAMDYFTPGLTRPGVRRIISFLRIFG